MCIRDSLAHDLPRNVSPQGSHAPSDDLPSSLQTHGGSPDGEKASNSEEIERPDETLRAAAKEETPANRSDTGGGLPTNPQHRRGLPNSMLFRHPRSRRKLGGHGARARRMRGDVYKRQIEGIPEDIAVRDYCLGTHWSYVEADCGMGVSFTCKGGARRACKQDLRGTCLLYTSRRSRTGSRARRRLPA